MTTETDKKLRPEYAQELEDLKRKMLDAQAFAEKLPVFADRILENKFTGEFTGTISNNYKSMYFNWGIQRYFYREKDHVINYRGEFFPQYLWKIYINQVSLFNEYIDTGLHDIKQKVEVFFFDNMNTTFYATDDQLIPLLDALCDWHQLAVVINGEHRKEKKKQDLLNQLEKLG